MIFLYKENILYTIRNKPNNFQKWNDTEFSEQFRLKKKYSAWLIV